MGCWNGTDGFGGMPLRIGDKVKAVLIQNNINLPEASGFCYLNGFALPISFVIEGTYDDYGNLDSIDENSLSSELLLNIVNKELKEGLIKVSSENSYNVNLKTEATTVEHVDTINELLDLIERDRVFRVKEDFGTKEIHYTNIGLMMFSDEIYTNILSKNKLENMLKDVSYFTEDVMTKFEINEDHKEILKHLELKEDQNKETRRMIKEIKEKGTLFQNYWGQKSRSVDTHFNHVESLNGFGTVDIDIFRDYFEILKYQDFKSEDIEKLLFDFLSLKSFMTSLRRSWSSSSGKGGQDYESSVFIAFGKSILKQAIRDYTDLKGQKVYCYEPYLKFKENEEYEVLDVREDKIVFSIDGEYYDITFSEFDSCLEN